MNVLPYELFGVVCSYLIMGNEPMEVAHIRRVCKKWKSDLNAFWSSQMNLSRQGLFRRLEALSWPTFLPDARARELLSPLCREQLTLLAGRCLPSTTRLSCSFDLMTIHSLVFQEEQIVYDLAFVEQRFQNLGTLPVPLLLLMARIVQGSSRALYTQLINTSAELYCIQQDRLSAHLVLQHYAQGGLPDEFPAACHVVQALLEAPRQIAKAKSLQPLLEAPFYENYHIEHIERYTEEGDSERALHHVLRLSPASPAQIEYLCDLLPALDSHSPTLRARCYQILRIFQENIPGNDPVLLIPWEQRLSRLQSLHIALERQLLPRDVTSVLDRALPLYINQELAVWLETCYNLIPLPEVTQKRVEAFYEAYVTYGRKKWFCAAVNRAAERPDCLQRLERLCLQASIHLISRYRQEGQRREALAHIECAQKVGGLPLRSRLEAATQQWLDERN